MRMNLPVTQREHVFPDDAVLLGHIDARGIITGVNRASPDVSGYSREDLGGKPRNLPRHLEMPSGSIRDVWASPASQKVIVGCVTPGTAGPVQSVCHA